MASRLLRQTWTKSVGLLSHDKPHTHDSIPGKSGLHRKSNAASSYALCPIHKQEERLERNPLRAGIVKESENYPWSSASAHCGRRDDKLLSNCLSLTGVIRDWSEWLKEPERDGELGV